MYESFFGLSRRPFSATPDPDCCAAVETTQSAFDELCAFVDQGEGIAILSAPAGTGKTLLCQRLAGECQREYRTACLANGNFETRRSLLQAVLYELGRPYLGMDEQELRLELTSAVNAAIRKSKGVFLIVDEAHLADRCVLDEIRSLTNLVRQGIPLVRVVLSAQLQFEELLTAPEFDAVNQRIRAHVTLEPISREESLEYIEFRLVWAGASSNDVFSPEAAALIAHVSDGIPRCINQLCDHSLFLAFAAGERPVGKSTVAQALDDLKRLPMQWQLPESMLENPAGRISNRDEGTSFATHAGSRTESSIASEAGDESSFAIEIGEGVEFTDSKPVVRGTAEPGDGFGDSAVIEIGGPEVTIEPATTIASQPSPSRAAGAARGGERPTLETQIQAEQPGPMPAPAQPDDVSGNGSRAARRSTASPDTSARRRDRRPSESPSPRHDFWTSFESPAFVEEKVHVLATTTRADVRKETHLVRARDEVVMDRYAAIDAVTATTEKPSKSTSATAQRKVAKPSPSPAESTSIRPLPAGRDSKALKLQRAQPVDQSPGSASSCDPVDLEHLDIITAVEEEIVSLVREASTMARGTADDQMIDDLAASAMERLRRSRQQASRLVQPQYDVIQPVDDARCKASRPVSPESEKSNSRPTESAPPVASADRAGVPQSRTAQLFSDLRSRRSS